MVGEEEAVTVAVTKVAAAEVEAAEVEAAEVRTTLVLAPVVESKVYVTHSARTCLTTVRRFPPIRREPRGRNWSNRWEPVMAMIFPTSYRTK